MPEQEKKEQDIKNLDLVELTDDDLEEASGGQASLDDSTPLNDCPIANFNC
jgi:hypothetical protein